MNDLRKAAEMALEALIWHDETVRTKADSAAITTLRAALAQPEQTAMPPDIAKVLFDNVESLYVTDDLPQLTKWTPMAEYAAKSAAVPGRAEALKQAGYTRRPRQLPKEDEQEPLEPACEEDMKVYAAIAKNYTKRVPLTDELIDILARTMVKGDKSVNWLCRVIEAEHGIGDK